jgi:hypothetical protein
MRSSFRDYLPDLFSFFVDFGICYGVCLFFFPDWSPWLALAAPLAIRLIVAIWTFYGIIKKLIWIANFDSRRKIELIVSHFAEFNFPPPPFFFVGEPQDYLEAIASHEGATSDQVYQAAFLAGALKGASQVSFFDYRLTLSDFREGIQEYGRQFVAQSDGSRIHKSRLRSPLE